MALQDDLRAAIEKNLSAEVGAALKELLASAERDAAALVENRKFVESLKGQVEALSATVLKAGDLDKKAQDLRTKESEVNNKLLRAEIVALKEEHAKERVADMKHLVSLVFQNNQFKYSLTETGNLPAGTDQYGNTKSAYYNKTATAEGVGAPPPPPAGTP
jgi:hypothetical protein